MKYEIEMLLNEVESLISNYQSKGNEPASIVAESLAERLRAILAVDQPDTSMHEMD